MSKSVIVFWVFVLAIANYHMANTGGLRTCAIFNLTWIGTFLIGLMWIRK